ncbi:MAG: murein biosynthesis integral membrane protein MurJ [Deltaproteobacteria bacterium]|nr:MAG: murein biosynthesis integral membrane protein MurJ [Deltaproteobacteria bacterium]
MNPYPVNADKKSLYRKVGTASAIMMASVFLSRIIGLLREMVIACVGGAGPAVDAYQIAFVIPEILNHILATGFLSVTFIPIFSGYLSADREDEGWIVLSVIHNTFGAVLIVFIAGAVICAPFLVDLLAPGICDPAVRSGAVRMTRIILPAQFFFFSGGLFMAVQFAREKFFIPALAPLVYNAGIIAGGICLGPWLGMEGFSWGVLAGAFVGNFVLQYRGGTLCGMHLSARFDLRHRELKKYVWLTLPLMFGLTMTFSTEIFFKYFGSYLPAGSIAGLNYGMRIMMMMVGLFGQAVGVASFPFMAGLAAQNKITEMNRLLNTTLRYLALVIPFSVLLIVLRHEVVLLIFQRGQFDAAATGLTSSILGYLMIGAFGFAAQTVVVRGFYALQNTLLPAVFGTFAVGLSIPLYIYGMKMMGAAGVALAISLSAVLQVLLLYGIWNRRSRNPQSREVCLFYVKTALLSLLLWLVLKGVRHMLLIRIDADTFMGCLAISAITAAVFAGLFLAIGYGLPIREIPEFVNRLLRRKSEGTKKN